MGHVVFIRRMWHTLLCMLCLVSWGGGVRAQSIETVLAPGQVIEGHAKVEQQCIKCHVRFDRAAQDGLCQDCHRDVAADMRAKTGFHGRQKPQACRECHTDHKGRNASVAAFDRKHFDHTQTDFRLRGKHSDLECAKCHVAGKKFRDAASDCNSCHRKDDVHKGSLGVRCAECHTETHWREAKFDHDTTRFALLGKHAEAKCSGCHRNGVYKDTPMQCVSCHRKDDKHRGQFGERCDSCHGVADWKSSRFNHDVDTRYVLRGKHRNTKCSACHTGHLYRDKAPSACVDCHRTDDTHKGTLGAACEACHVESRWKETGRFDHDRTHFPLLGKHAKAQCQDCHRDARYTLTPKTCVGCHRQDDKHEGTLGERCADCHGELDWKRTVFDHDRSRFKLRGAHAGAAVKCTSCHRDLRSYRATPMACIDCHRKDDKHEGQLGGQCASCHGDRQWKSTSFDHARSRFALTGKHVGIECKACHASPRYKDAKTDCYSCHRKDDKHKGRFGTSCDSCHTARDWALWQFDHTRATRFALKGGHRAATCESCHVAPAPTNRSIAPVGSTCVACHRRDDVHDGAFGARCEQCHVEDNWRSARRPLSQSSDATPILRRRNALLGSELAHASAPHLTLETP